MSRSSTTSGTATQSGKTTQAAGATQGQSCAATAGCPPLDKVAALAYQKWLKKGCKHGNDRQDWLEAEAELKAEMARTTGKK